MINKLEIRLIKKDDAAAVLDIYKHYVLNTIVSFEYKAPSLAEFEERIHTVTSEYPWLVCLQDGEIIGYAYAGKHRYRTAYQWSPESTVYLRQGTQRRGIGRILYSTLFSILKLQGYFNVYAGVGLPNEGSVGFHKAMGFEEIGVFKKVGYKMGNWHDTHWFQYSLTECTFDPPAPIALPTIVNLDEINAILLAVNKQLNP